MFFRVLCLLTIAGWFQVHGYVPVPVIYRKVEGALRRYSSNADHNPIVYSLLNALVHDKKSRAFITDEAIEKALKDIKNLNQNDELVIRKLIYGTENPSKSQTLPTDVRENVESALDVFFSHPNVDDNQTLDLLSKKKNPESK